MNVLRVPYWPDRIAIDARAAEQKAEAMFVNGQKRILVWLRLPGMPWVLAGVSEVNESNA